MAFEVFLEANLSFIGKLLIESDSFNAVNWCSSPTQRPWKLWELFHKIDALVSKIGEVAFLNIYREANGFANLLTKEGLRRSCFFKAWW
ncbi:hypothetical protein REPUB_Repub16aG0026000 [Reevesia pubescens]